LHGMFRKAATLLRRLRECRLERSHWPEAVVPVSLDCLFPA
jgi:hypothetical protein